MKTIDRLSDPSFCAGATFRLRPEFVAEALRKWIAAVGDGDCEISNSKLWDLLPNGEDFYTFEKSRSSSKAVASTAIDTIASARR